MNGSSDIQFDINDKLKKILALTQSPVEGEAQAAAAHLARLLEKYNLDVADLETRGAAAKKPVGERNHDLGKAAFKWKLDLAEEIAEHYFCVPLVNRTKKTVAFVGRPENVESLTMLYQWLIDQIKRLSTETRRTHFDSTGEHVDPLRWQVSFGEGAAERLGERLREMRAREREDAEGSTHGAAITALVVSHAREASDYLEERYGYRLDGRPTKKQQEREARYEAEQARLEALKASDIEAFYAECPWERPKTPEQEAAEQKEWEAYRKKEAKNARRRQNYIPTGSYREKRIDERKEAQARTATKAGRSNADRVNLQPFLNGGDKEKRRIG